MPERQRLIHESRPPEISQELWSIIIDPAAMNPELPDIESFELPPGFTEETWKRYAVGYERTFHEEYPHPPAVILSVCTGSPDKGSKGHAVQLLLVSQKWQPPEESGEKFGMWRQDEVIELTAWISAEQAPENVTFGNNTVTITGKSSSTGGCPDCHNK